MPNLQLKHQYTYKWLVLRQTRSISSLQTSKDLTVSTRERQKGKAVQCGSGLKELQEPCPVAMVSEMLEGSSVSALQWLQYKAAQIRCIAEHTQVIL